MIRRWVRDRSGAAALEIALWLGFLLVPLLNAVDVGYYAFQAIQVRESAQAAAQAALQLCGPFQLTFPAATNCTGLSSAFTTAAQGTTLGTHVTVSTWKEGYYCMTITGTLAQVGTVPAAETAPNANGKAECSTFGANYANNDNNSGDYLSVTTTYTFKPLFKGVTIASLLTSPTTATAIMRVG